MDRQTVYAAAIAILVMFVLGGLMLGPEQAGTSYSPAPSYPAAQRQYSPGDIRYNLQQAEIKKAQKQKKKITPPKEPTPDQFVTDGSTSSGVADDAGSGDYSNEEPSVFDHPPQEEPPLD